LLLLIANGHDEILHSDYSVDDGNLIIGKMEEDTDDGHLIVQKIEETLSLLSKNI